MKKMMLFLICIQCLFSCSVSSPKDMDSLCQDFCKLNKGQKFRLLFETSTANSRFKNGIPTEIGVYCKEVQGSFMTIPLTFKELKSRNLYGSSHFYECKNNSLEDSLFFTKYISDFNNEDSQIKVPPYYQYEKPKTHGNPHLGKFIEFTLDEKCSVYYLEDANSLTPYWKDKFSKLQKVDNEWYYECK